MHIQEKLPDTIFEASPRLFTLTGWREAQKWCTTGWGLLALRLMYKGGFDP
jgi:hypothetical protein